MTEVIDLEQLNPGPRKKEPFWFLLLGIIIILLVIPLSFIAELWNWRRKL